MTLYLIDEPFAEVGLSYAACDPDAKVVLVQDAVQLAGGGRLAGAVYAIREDVARRGLSGLVDSLVQVIGYDDLVEMMEKEHVLCFL